MIYMCIYIYMYTILCRINSSKSKNQESNICQNMMAHQCASRSIGDWYTVMMTKLFNHLVSKCVTMLTIHHFWS